MLETELHFCSPVQALPKSSLQHHSPALSSAVLGTKTFAVCRCWQKQWESHRLGSKNLKALFYSGYSDLAWVREKPLHNIHSNCSFSKRKIFPGRLPQGEILSLQLRAEVVFKQEGEEQAHSAIPCAWKAALDLLAWFFSSSWGHGVAGCVFVTLPTQRWWAWGHWAFCPLGRESKWPDHLVDLQGEFWEQSPWTHTQKWCLPAKTLDFFSMGRYISGLLHSHNLSTSSAHTRATQESTLERMGFAFLTPLKAHVKDSLGNVLLAPSMLSTQSLLALPQLALSKCGCLWLLCPKGDSPPLHSCVFLTEWIICLTPEVKSSMHAKWAKVGLGDRISQGIMGWENGKKRGKTSLAV